MQKFKLTQKEVMVISIAMNLDAAGQIRRYPKAMWKVVGNVSRQIQPLFNKNNEIPPGNYQLEFSGDEKKIIVENVNDKNWTWIDCQIAESVIEKLSVKETDKK